MPILKSVLGACPQSASHPALQYKVRHQQPLQIIPEIQTCFSHQKDHCNVMHHQKVSWKNLQTKLVQNCAKTIEHLPLDKAR